MPLDRPGDHPDQVLRGGRVGTDVAVGPGFEAEGGHLLLAGDSQDDDRLVGPPCPVAADQVHRVQFTRLVADQHGVVGFVAEPGQPGRTTEGLLKLDLRPAFVSKRLRQPPAGPRTAGNIEDSHPRGDGFPRRGKRSFRRTFDGSTHESLHAPGNEIGRSGGRTLANSPVGVNRSRLGPQKLAQYRRALGVVVGMAHRRHGHRGTRHCGGRCPPYGYSCRPPT